MKPVALGPAEVTTEQIGNVRVVRVTGEVDLSNRIAIEDEALAVMPNSDLGMILDLTPTTYLDSAGIHMVFSLRTKLERRRQSLQVVLKEGSSVDRIFSMVKLTAAMPVFFSIEDALAASEAPAV